MGYKFFKQSMGDNKELFKKNINLLLNAGYVYHGNFVSEEEHGPNKNEGVRGNCSILGNTDYRINRTPHADNGLLHIFFYFMENIEIDGLDKEAKNKMFIDEIIKCIKEQDCFYCSDFSYISYASYFLASSFELLAVNNYKINRETLEELVGNIFIKVFSSCDKYEKLGVADVISASSKSILDSLKKLYDGCDFGKVINDCLIKSKTENKIGGNKKIISQVQFDEKYNFFSFSGISWNKDYHKGLESYIRDFNKQYKEFAETKSIEEKTKNIAESNENHIDDQETNNDSKADIDVKENINININDVIDKSEDASESKIESNNKTPGVIAKININKTELKKEYVCQKINKTHNKFSGKEQRQCLCNEYSITLMIRIFFNGIFEILKGNVKRGMLIIKTLGCFDSRQKLFDDKSFFSNNKNMPKCCTGQEVKGRN